MKKIFFSPKGPPFGFRVICSPAFGLREGFIFKLESSGFNKTSSFCDLHPRVNAKKSNSKILILSSPPNYDEVVPQLFDVVLPIFFICVVVHVYDVSMLGKG